MKISILTAVYNTAAYLPQCIESVLAQTHTDWQMVCVDDGSTDNSLDVLNRYAARDSRILVLDKEENQGQAKARNEAYSHTDGGIVMMLDSDDWLAQDALEKIAAVFAADTEVDSVLLRVMLYHSDSDVRVFENEVSHTISGHEAFHLSLGWRIHGVYASRRAIYERCLYDDSLHSFSDDNTTRFHYLDSRKVAFSDATYYYRQRHGSVTHKADLSRFILLKSLLNLKADIDADPRVTAADISELNLFIWHNIQGAYMHYYACRHRFPRAERREAWETLRQCHKKASTVGVPLKEHLRFGYSPIKWCPALYRLQMCVFTHIRHFVGLDKHRYD